MTDATHFTIEELAEQTRRWLEEHRLDDRYYRRVQETPSERTIRYYRSQGLLDEPARDGARRLYGRRHMLQLLAVKSLQTQGLSHQRIQAELYGRSDAELEALIAATLPPRHASDPPPVRDLVEVALGPGLRLLADRASLAAASDAERRLLVERFEAALAALAGDHT